MTVAVIIVAAGRGRRLGGEVPKQYIALGDSCALRLSVEAFLSVNAVDWVLPVINAEDKSLLDNALMNLADSRVLAPVEGGDTRARSVRRGLEALEQYRPDSVLIHDAARPFISGRVIGEVLSALDESYGACAALPVVDALWKCDRNHAQVPVPRDGLWRAQTPQGFRFDRILEAHRMHDGTGADDVAVARAAGVEVTLVPGSEQNYKITTAADLERARRDFATIQKGTIET